MTLEVNIIEFMVYFNLGSLTLFLDVNFAKYSNLHALHSNLCFHLPPSGRCYEISSIIKDLRVFLFHNLHYTSITCYYGLKVRFGRKYHGPLYSISLTLYHPGPLYRCI